MEESKEKSENLKKEESKEDNSFCCGCCIGLAVGYALWYGGGDCEDISPKENDLEKEVGKEINIKDNSPNNLKTYVLSKIDFYQVNISPKIKQDLNVDHLCSFDPSCSEYAKQAIEKYGMVKGSGLAIKRLAKCNPFSEEGKDPLV